MHRSVTFHICLFLWSMKRVFVLPSISTDLLRFGLEPCNRKFWKIRQVWISRHARVPLARGLRVLNVECFGEGVVGALGSDLRFRKFFWVATVATSPVVLRWLCDSPRTGCAWRITPYIHVARTSNNRVIMACELYCCLLLQHEALRICRSGFPIAALLSSVFEYS